MKIRDDGRLDYAVTCPICPSKTRSVTKPQFKVCRACKDKAKASVPTPGPTPGIFEQVKVEVKSDGT